MMDLFSEMYKTTEHDNIGPEYNPPNATIEEWRGWVKVAEFKGKGDGQDCEIFESRMPARFFKLQVKTSPNSIGEIQPSYQVRTGSGNDMGKLLMKIAKEIAEGMIGFYPDKEVIPDDQ